jgi:hypothetical protein
VASSMQAMELGHTQRRQRQGVAHAAEKKALAGKQQAAAATAAFGDGGDMEVDEAISGDGSISGGQMEQ